MKPLLLPILILFLSGCASTTVSGTFGGSKPDVSATINIPIALDQKKQLVTEMGIVYVGMPKEDLAKVGFTEYSQKGYHKEGNEEWITFSDWMTEESGDLITFYLVDGKVKGWKEK